LSERGARDGHVLAASRLLGEATAEARGVATEEVIVAGERPLLRAECPAAVLRHETSRSSRIRISGRRECCVTRRYCSSTCCSLCEAFFERLLGEAFEVARREVLPSGPRVICDALSR
jgi:hypothetical protein